MIYPSSIHISLDEYKEKMVTVAPVLLIRPAPGYTLVGKSSISPETIKIAGSRNIVEGIGSVSTIPDTIQNATTRISLTLELASIRGQLIEYTPKTKSSSICQSPNRILNGGRRDRFHCRIAAGRY